MENGLLALVGLASAGGGAVVCWLFSRRRSRQKLQVLKESWIQKMEREVVDRRQTEQELAHLASFAEMSPEPIVELRPEGRSYLNPAAEKLFPDLLTTLEHPILAGVDALVKTLQEEKRTIHVRWVEFGGRIYSEQICFLERGPIIRIYLSDITELKRLDQLKSDFVNMTSHELRTPLTSIQAMVKMVAQGMVGPIAVEQQRALDVALESIERLNRLINDLLDVARIEAGKMELHRSPVDLGQVVPLVRDMFQPLARERGLALDARLDKKPLVISADRDRLIQVFTNLTQNALKFTRQGGVTLSAEQAGDEIICKVADTGAGIGPAELPRVFGKFQQFASAAQSTEKGSGLGLSLCKGFVELHGGHIQVESILGQGTTFTFTLPVEIAA